MTEPSAYDRGVTAGAIETRLAGHDKHFAAINGSLDKIAIELQGVKSAVQSLADGAIARDATIIATAKALKDAEYARIERDTQRWSPLQRLLLVLGILTTLVGTYAAIRGLT